MPRTNFAFPTATTPTTLWITAQTMKQMTETSKHRETNRDRQAVLIADDDPAQRREICEHLTHLGVNVIEAEDGIEAVVQIDRYNPALAVMDIRMPHCDGIRAAKIASSLSPRTPVILMSGFPEELRRAEAIGCGAYTLLQKPISLNWLKNFIQQLRRKS